MSEQDRNEFEILLLDAVNDTLTASEQVRFDALLEQYPAWQSDLDTLETLREGLQAYPELELPSNRWDKLAARIAETRVIAHVAPTKSRWISWLDAINRPWIAVAALVVVVAQGVFFVPMGMHSQSIEYRGSKAIPAEAQWTISFNGDATEAQMRDLLLRARFDIVSGPNAAGEYGLAPQSDADVSLLRQSKLVQALGSIQH